MLGDRDACDRPCRPETRVHVANAAGRGLPDPWTSSTWTAGGVSRNPQLWLHVPRPRLTELEMAAVNESLIQTQPSVPEEGPVLGHPLTDPCSGTGWCGETGRWPAVTWG